MNMIAARAPRPLTDPLTADEVRDVYRLMLGRDPENQSVIDSLVGLGFTRDRLIARIIASHEFAFGPVAARLNHSGWSFDLMSRAARCDAVCLPYRQQGVVAEPGFYKDFLGVRTRCSYVPGLHAVSGQVFGLPGEGQAIEFDPAEWEATLRAVDEAKGRLVVFELGAGWAPWLVTAGVAARIRGVGDVQLVGVEADPGHYAMMLQHMTDNGLDPHRHLLLEGVVGVSDGVAHFPRLADSTMDWGAQAVFDAAASPSNGGQHIDYRGLSFTHMDEKKSYSLANLITRFARVDVIHCDIQDGEIDVIPAAFQAIDARVRRFLLGTHSREAEAVAIRHFGAAGWVLEAEAPCAFSMAHGRSVAFRDGVQAWVNPKLA